MLESAKKVMTKDLSGKENGFLIELTKDGKLTTSYLSCCYPGAFKGYHLHKVRAANYVCVRGKLTVILYYPSGVQEVTLDASRPERLHIPPNVPTGLRNDGTEEAWIINNPQPAYDPDLKDEQVDFTQEQLDAVVKMYEGFVPFVAPFSYIPYVMPYDISGGSTISIGTISDGITGVTYTSDGITGFGLSNPNREYSIGPAKTCDTYIDELAEKTEDR